MKKNELINKTLAGLMIAAMTAGVCPTTAFAVTGDQVAKDGTYTATAHVMDEEGEGWSEYDVAVSLEVKDGKFANITVTPSDSYNSESNLYFNWAKDGKVNKKTGVTYKGFSSLVGQDATADNAANGWDIVSGATCTSKTVKSALAEMLEGASEAVKVDTTALQAAINEAKKLNESEYPAERWATFAAALEAAEKALTSDSQDDVNNAATALKEAQAKLQAQVKVDTAALQAAIDEAKTLKEADYTANSWKTFVEALAAAEKATAATDQTTVDEALKNLTDAQKALVNATVSTDVYVLMNIPYDKFYAAEGDDDVDAVTSATKQKTRNSGLTAGSYHVNSDGTDITGVVYPVKVSDISSLEKYTKITDESKVDITVSGKGGEQTTTYEGKDALFESASYSYYVLSEAPSYYKEATVNEDGTLSFGKVEGTEVKTLSGVTAKFSTSSKYGDYQINLSGLPSDITTVYGVVVGTKEGSNYGMRHLENIWRISELAWSTGFVTSSKGNTLSYEGYKAMMGQTINKITYYTNAGIYEIPVDIKVPVKFNGSVKVENGKASDGIVSATVEGLPDDYAAEYSVDGLSDVKFENGKLTFAAAQARGGRYTLTVSDKSEKYTSLTAEFVLSSEVTPIAYDSDKEALVAVDGYTADDVNVYVKNIQSVSVKGTAYSATGKKGVTIINADGTINTAAKPFADAKDGQEFEIEVTSEGYDNNYKFTYKANTQYKYVYAGLTWAEYWANEAVYKAGDPSTSKAVDKRGESDKGAFDTVTRATTNHGLHRGSYQCTAVIEGANGKEYKVSHWTDANTAVLTDGSTIRFEKGTITEADGSTTTMVEYDVTGIKYVPVKVAAADYEDFCKQYAVVENGGTLTGGYSEGKLSSYTEKGSVTVGTNGLKTATKNTDGTFSFSASENGPGSGISKQSLKTAPSAEEAGLTVKEANGSYGEFLRVDLTGNYGDLGSNMQAVTWTYYGNDGTYSNALATYGTKFAADNWMHKSMGIQLGLTDSLRCQLPEGTDGTGYWTITIRALGYEDATYKFEATDKNIVKGDDAVQDTSKLEAAIKEAEGLNAADYTEDSWKAMQLELAEAKEEFANPHTQSTVDEATEHLNVAIKALVKVTAEDEYSYVYVGMTWAEYWANEDVYKAGSTESSSELDSHGEYDKGAFDTVTRATTNHGLHRGSFQCIATIYDKEGNSYKLAGWNSSSELVLTDGSTVAFDSKAKTINGKAFDRYEVTGLKYVPVKVKTSDLEALKAKYTVVENGGTLFGGYGEEELKAYSETANVTANTYGLKEAVKSGDSFTFTARENKGTESGIKDQALKTATNVTPTVKAANGSYGEFLRVDITGEGYGDLGANMQAVTWTYYGNDGTYSNALATYGTKFATDNWMHKTNGIQLGLTDSIRCQLPEGTDGTGYWKLTVRALGYEDYTYTFEATDANIVKPSEDAADTTALKEAVAKAEALNESDYTADSWAAMQMELGEAKELLEKENPTQAEVDEATSHLNAAIDALERVETPAEVNTEALAAAIAKAEGLKEADYTADSWKAMQTSLTAAKAALEAKESQEAVDAAAANLQSSIDALKAATPSETDDKKAVDTATLEKTIATAKGLKKNDYTAATWTTLQTALTNAEKALDAKESQKSVDEAAKTLQAAIDGLKKASDTTATTDDKKNNNSNKNNNNSTNKNNTTTNKNNTTSKNSPKTGDPVSVLGLLGAAISSVGIGGLGLRLRKKSKREDEE